MLPYLKYQVYTYFMPYIHVYWVLKKYDADDISLL